MMKYRTLSHNERPGALVEQVDDARFRAERGLELRDLVSIEIRYSSQVGHDVYSHYCYFRYMYFFQMRKKLKNLRKKKAN